MIDDPTGKRTLKQIVREKLESLKIHEDYIYPSRLKNTVYSERVDLTLFHGYEFKGSRDDKPGWFRMQRTK